MRRNTDLSLAESEKKSYGAYYNYVKLLNRHFDFEGIEPDLHEKRIAAISNMAQLSSSGVTVYDMQNMVHIYTSRNFYELHGYERSERNEISNKTFDRKIHPDDLSELNKNGYLAMQYILKVPPDCRKQYKMISEYRILTKNQSYTRVIEQQQVLEQDAAGNIWLALGILDISPDQSDFDRVKFQIINLETGELVTLDSPVNPNAFLLTIREKEILRMIGNGKLSKEISSILDISVHTVNTHRQRILDKLEVNNSIEALYSARSLGLIA